MTIESPQEDTATTLKELTASLAQVDDPEKVRAIQQQIADLRWQILQSRMKFDGFRRKMHGAAEKASGQKIIGINDD